MPSVLVVDDTAVDRQLAGGLLEKSPNLTVSFAENGMQALELIQQSCPDLVVTDLQMPEMDGLQLLTSITQSHPEVPVILMTAHGSEVVAAQALANGAASYVPKHSLADNLVETVTHILSMSVTDQRYSRLIQCSTKTEFEFELDNAPELIEPLVELVQQVASSMHLCDSTGRIRIGVALENAIENAMIRGNLELPKSNNDTDDSILVARQNDPTYRDRKVFVNALITRDQARFIIRDDGPGFDVQAMTNRDESEALRGAGRGLVLMRNFMDECDFNDRGNEVTLVKHCQRP